MWTRAQAGPGTTSLGAGGGQGCDGFLADGVVPTEGKFRSTSTRVDPDSRRGAEGRQQLGFGAGPWALRCGEQFRVRGHRDGIQWPVRTNSLVGR